MRARLILKSHERMISDQIALHSVQLPLQYTLFFQKIHICNSTIQTPALKPRPRVQTEICSFSSFSKKYASTRSVFESFSPVHTETLKRWKYDASLNEHASCYEYKKYDIIVFENLRLRSSTHKRKAGVFKNLKSEERFLKDVFSVGQTGEKNIHFQTKRIREDEAQIFSLK